MSEKRIIKKYPNRRLYDTAISSYITLEDVKRLILDNVDVYVIDARSKNDITHNTLMQIIVEQEESSEPLFSTEVLQAFIRLHGASMQSVMSKLLEQSTLYFLRQQKTLQESLGQKEHVNPLAFLSHLTEQNLSVWRQMQEQWWQSFNQAVVDTPETQVPVSENLRTTETASTENY